MFIWIAGFVIDSMDPTKRQFFPGLLLRRIVKEQPLGTLGGVVVLLLVFVSILAGVVAPYEPAEVHLVDRLTSPSSRYLLGTDHLGRDLLSRLIYGARISIFVGLAATTINVVVAVLIGAPSGYFGGKLDLAVQRSVDAWMAFPGLLILLTIMSVVGQGLPQIILVLGIAGGIGGSRVIRGAVMGIKENDYFLAAQAVGTPTRQIQLCSAEKGASTWRWRRDWRSYQGCA